MASQEAGRPDPDELLRQIQAQEARNSCGRLKIFLGYAPRVGKSLRMFDEGLRRKHRGQDVVVGAIQTKGSSALEAMIQQFDVIPPLRMAGEDTVNVDAIVRRRPQVCLIDELARDNPPPSLRAHRWQDVETIRQRGIHVVGALNLHHILEQQDEVARITGKRAAASVPQAFIEAADEIVMVDVPSDELCANGAGPGNLTPAQISELREAALLLAAQVIEGQLQRFLEDHGIVQSRSAQERILVCVTPRKTARAMLESGARAASRFHGQLLAVTVQNGEPDRAAQEALHEHLALAQSLGAEVHKLEGRNAADTIVSFAREHRVTQIFVGHTRQSGWKLWTSSPVDRLIETAEGMDLRIFPSPPEAA